MNTRLEFATEALAQACADKVHAEMQKVDPDYAKSVQLGHTTAWAIPYYDDKALVWCVNIKDRADKAITPVERSRLKEITKPVVEIVVK